MFRFRLRFRVGVRVRFSVIVQTLGFLYGSHIFLTKNKVFNLIVSVFHHYEKGILIGLELCNCFYRLSV